MAAKAVIMTGKMTLIVLIRLKGSKKRLSLHAELNREVRRIGWMKSVLQRCYAESVPNLNIVWV